MDPLPPINKALSHILQEEKQREVRASNSSLAFNQVVFVVKSGAPQSAIDSKMNPQRKIDLFVLIVESWDTLRIDIINSMVIILAIENLKENPFPLKHIKSQT